MEAPSEKHPYLRVLEDQLRSAKLKKELLEKRIIFLIQNTGTAYQNNEDQITILDTKSQINSLERVIREKESYFIKFMQQFIEDSDEMESNFDRVKQDAYKKAETDTEMAEFLKRVFWDNLERNIEAKIGMYKMIKQKL